jgi:hypothetical protein
LVFIRWADTNLDKNTQLVFEIPLFLAYIALVGWRVGRISKRRGLMQPRCPACGATLQETSQRIAAATGKCDTCGGQVIG